jgi:hypothetical protein
MDNVKEVCHYIGQEFDTWFCALKFIRLATGN